MSRAATPEEQAARLDPLRKQWAGQLHDLAKLIESMAEAMANDDPILGPVASAGVADHLAALPSHIRHLFTEHLSDEAARGFRADQLYIESLDAGVDAP